jgi:hypothetical protein
MYVRGILVIIHFTIFHLLICYLEKQDYNADLQHYTYCMRFARRWI